MSGQAGSAAGCEDAPFEEAVDPLQLRPCQAALQRFFECFMQSVGFLGRELKVYGLSLGWDQWLFSR